MSRVRGPTWVPWAMAATALALLLIPGAASTGISAEVDAPLLGDPVRLDLEAAGTDPVSVEIGLPVAAPFDVELAGLEVKSGPDATQRPQGSPAAAPAPPPSPTPPDLPDATRMAAGSIVGAAAMGTLAAAPAMPWESLAAALSNWFNQAREAARPVAKGAGRILKALPFLTPLFARIGGENLLQNPVRARMNEVIAQDPGLSLQDVRDRAGVAWGTTVHHLTRLERHGLVVSVRHGNHRRYFPANTTESRHRRELSALSHPTARRIATHVSTNPGTDQKSLCLALDLQNPAASKHLTRFEGLGLVQSEIVGRSRLYHPTELMHSVLRTLAGLGGMTQAPVPVAAQSVQPSVAVSPPAPMHRAPLVDALPESSMMGRDVAVAT